MSLCKLGNLIHAPVSIATRCVLLPIGLLLVIAPSLAQTPAGGEWHVCLGTAQCREFAVGSGALAESGSMVRVRLTDWTYEPGAQDFKGLKLGDGRPPREVGYELIPTPASAYGFTMTDLIVGMRVGGRRTITLPLRRIVMEVELLDVAPTAASLRSRGYLPGIDRPSTLSARASPVASQEDAERAREQYRRAREENELKARREAESRQAAINEQLSKEAADRSALSEKYPALVAEARARNKIDPVALGIILGEKWRNVQDVNNCRVENWTLTSNIPFCLYPEADFTVPINKRWQTCVRIDETKFDISWIISHFGDAEVEVDGLGAALVAFAVAKDKARNCFVDVDVLADGTVGRVSMATSLRAHHIDTLVAQLKSKYGTRFSVSRQNWTNGNKTANLEWSLPGIRVKYQEQVEKSGGGAFNGGFLEIFTPAWTRATDEEARKNKKPAL